MSKLDMQFTATLKKSPNKGGWTYVVMPGSAEYFGTRSREGERHRRWPPVPKFVHGSRGRYAQAAHQSCYSQNHLKGSWRNRDCPSQTATR